MKAAEEGSATRGVQVRTVAVLLAGGAGERLGAAVPKQLLEISGTPIVERTIAAFDSSPDVDEVVVVMVPGFAEEVRRIVERAGYRKVTRVLDGGRTRMESTYRGLTAVGAGTAGTADTAIDVLLHDAARPLVDHRIIADCVRALRTHQAVSVAVPSSDTIFVVDSTASGGAEPGVSARGDEDPHGSVDDQGAAERGCEGGGGPAGGAAFETIATVPSRATVRRAQTPQGFRLETIRAAYQQAIADPAFAATDDAAVVMRYLPEVPVCLVPGSESNIKITYSGDIPHAEALLRLGRGSG